MQRYIARRALQSLLTLWVMTLIVFTLARISGNPLDVMLPMEAGPEEYERVSKHWGLDQPLFDVDSTVIIIHGWAEGARVGYNPKKSGRRSYPPLLCFEEGFQEFWAACARATPAPQPVLCPFSKSVWRRPLRPSPARACAFAWTRVSTAAVSFASWTPRDAVT